MRSAAPSPAVATGRIVDGRDARPLPGAAAACA